MEADVANTIDNRVLEVEGGPALELTEIVGSRDGPCLALIGGVHGDEDEGVLSVRRVVAALRERPIAGRVRALAMSNPAACAAYLRCTPEDGQNLARVFPGRPDGSLTERTAHAITERVLKGADALIDLHSAGRDFAMPLFCGYHADDNDLGRRCEALARAFGAPLTWAHLAVSQGRSLSAARDLGITAIYAEASGGSEVRGAETDAFVAGVLNVLRLLGLIDEPVRPVSSKLIRDPGGNTDAGVLAPASGTWVTRTAAGAMVGEGERLAEIYDEQGVKRAEVAAPRAGIVMMLRRLSRVSEGTSVAMVAAPPEDWI
jgi:predicted deacylase